MNTTIREIEDLKTKIHSFRVSDLQSLVASFGRSRNGKKQDLQNRALEILRTQPSDVDMLAFKRKIHELYRIAQDEAKQTTHYDFQPQQRVINQPTNYMGPGPYNLPSQPRPVGSTIIYQNGGIVSGNGYPNATVYPNQMIAPSIQPPPIIASNLGSTVRIISPPISHTTAKLKSLPFYRVKHEILKPTILKLKTNGRNNSAQIFQISFVLTCDIASDIAMNRDYSKNEYTVQAQLRICAIDNSNNEVSELDDFLPLGLYVRMNDKQCGLPPCSPCTRPNVEARRVPLPINITQFLRLSPMNVNKLTINWTPEVGRTFVACVNVVEKLTSSYLLDKLKEKSPISVETTKQIIAKQYKRVIDDDDDNEDADDDDIATTIVRVSLQCPLAKFRMMHPAKGKNCGHLQCFDGFAYISCNEKKSVWMCPVCNRPLHYDDLLIDQYFVDVLASEESTNCQEVQLFVDGSWKVFDEEDITDLSEKPKPKSPNPNSPGENLSIASSEELLNPDTDQKHAVSDNAVSTSGISATVPDSFVDLTEDDEEVETEVETEAETRTAIEESSSNTPSASVRSPIESNTTVEEIESPVLESLQLPSGLTTPVVSPAISPAPEPAQPTSSLTTPTISPAATPPLNLSPARSESTKATEEITTAENPMIISPSPSPEASISSANPSMVLSPSLSPVSRTNGEEVNEDEMESLRIDLENPANGGIERDVTMAESFPVRNETPQIHESVADPDEEDTIPERTISSFDSSDEDMPMEEGPSTSAALPVNASTMSTPERENINENSTHSILSLENAPSPAPDEMANLNLGN